MTTSQIVPDTEDRTRDMGGVEGFNRPPYASDAEQCAAQLHDLERFFGTAQFAEALRSYQDSPEFQARSRGLDPEALVRDINAVLRVAGDSASEAFADRMVAKARQAPVATPFPGATAVPAQSTAATAA